jgi:hypothetical protein
MCSTGEYAGWIALAGEGCECGWLRGGNGTGGGAIHETDKTKGSCREGSGSLGHTARKMLEQRAWISVERSQL